MKRCITVLSLVFLIGVTVSAAPNEWNGKYTNTQNNIETHFSYAGAFGNILSHLESATNLPTVTDGLGFLEVRNHKNATIRVNHNVLGYINIDFNNDYDQSNGIEIRIIGQDNVVNGTDTGIYGRDADNNTVDNRQTHGEDAIFIDESKNGSTYTFIEGRYWGGNHHNNASGKDGGDIKDLNKLFIYGTSFHGGDAGPNIKTANDETLGDFGGYGLRLADTFSTIITNSFDHDDTYAGGDGGRINANRNNNRVANAYGGLAFYHNGGTPAGNVARDLLMYNATLTGGNGGTITWDGGVPTNTEAYAYGGHGYFGTNINAHLVNGYFYGGNGGNAETEGFNSIIDSSGGDAIQIGHNITRKLVAVTNAYESYGGDGGLATASGGDSWVQAHGGAGLRLFGTSAGAHVITTSNKVSRFIGGNGGTALAPAGDSRGDGSGGSGIDLSGARTVLIGENDANLRGIICYGGDGGKGQGNYWADGRGGDGIRAVTSSVIVADGYFQGGNGGTALGSTLANGSGGNGLQAVASSVVISNGVFLGGQAGAAVALNEEDAIANEGYSVFSVDSNLKILDGYYMDGIVLNSANTGTATVIEGGFIGSIRFEGDHVHNIALNGGFYYGGITQKKGTVNVNAWSDPQVQNILIEQGKMNFNGAHFNLNPGGQIILGNHESSVSFNQGATLRTNSLLSIGSGQVTVNGDLELLPGANLYYFFDEVATTTGSLKIVNGQMSAAADAVIAVGGRVISRTNVLTLATAEAGVGNVNPDAIKMDMGWLTKYSVNNVGTDLDVVITDMKLAGTTLTNDIPLPVLNMLDTGMSDVTFASLNAAGYQETKDSLRVSYTQIPDTINAVFSGNKRINQLLTARGTDFRNSANLASAVPKFKKYAPTGPAGPINATGDFMAWIRTYGQTGERDAEDNFSKYDVSAVGYAVGIDKCFNKGLIGLAGGYGSSDLDGKGYDADVKLYHGSLYATVGGERTFLDVALTYGHSTTKSQTLLLKNDYDADLYSGYIGAGRSFYIGDTLAVIPEIAFQAAYYDQDAFEQKSPTGAPTGQIEAYDEWSYMSIAGISLAYLQEINLFEQDAAVLPEIRFKWYHEFNDELNDYTYVIGGVENEFAVRRRDEDLLDIGIGVEMWKWDNVQTKLQIDYDYITGDTYKAHTFNLKLSHEF